MISSEDCEFIKRFEKKRSPEEKQEMLQTEGSQVIDRPESLFWGQILSFIVGGLRPVRVTGVPEAPSHRTQGPRVDHRMEGPQMH